GARCNTGNHSQWRRGVVIGGSNGCDICSMTDTVSWGGVSLRSGGGRETISSNDLFIGELEVSFGKAGGVLIPAVIKCGMGNVNSGINNRNENPFACIGRSAKEVPCLRDIPIKTAFRE